MKLSITKAALLGLGILIVGMLLGRSWFAPGSEAEHTHGESTAAETIYTCSMHPQIRQNEPGDCPICGMDLTPLIAEGEAAGSPTAVSMSPTALQLARVATAEVGMAEPNRTLTLPGRVHWDERRVYNQTTHIPGRIERLMINFTGEYVKRGDVLAYIYSPELVTAQAELLQAQKYREEQPALFQAAYQRLAQWKLNSGQIDRILERGEVQEQFPLLADHAGYVLQKMVLSGDHVKQGAVLYQIVDLNRVWILLDVYEEDLAWIRTGDSVSLKVPALPGETFTGTLDYVDPILDPKTRTARARMNLQNPQGQLKPEMLATGTVAASGGLPTSALTVPKSAVLWTGKRSIVYVLQQSDQATLFELREVVLGPTLGESYVIEEGLEAGEIIAVQGTFSIDAAAQLAGKPSMMNMPEAHTAPSSGPLALAVHSTEQTYTTPDAFQAQLLAFFQAYLPFKDALVASNAKEALAQVSALRNQLGQISGEKLSAEAQATWQADAEVLRTVMDGLAQTQDLETLRQWLTPLSDQLYHTFRHFEVSLPAYRQFCPMAHNDEGAYWLSDSEEVMNPYFGDAMLHCGWVEETLSE